MLLFVVNTWLPHHAIRSLSRQVNLGSVFCRGIHSTTHDLAKRSSRRRELSRGGIVLDPLRSAIPIQAAIAVAPQRKSVASIHMR